jgi:NAD/NADP transhydrogenase alpha subunit
LGQFGFTDQDTGVDPFPNPQDEAYKKAGATIADSTAALGQDIIMKIRPPTTQEVAQMKENVK